MKKEPTQRAHRRGPIDPEELKRLKEIREKVRQEFPPLEPPRLQPAASGIGARVRAAREAQGLTWYAVAKRAGIPNPSTVRDIEYGRDTKLSSLQAVADVLGLSLELVEARRADTVAQGGVSDLAPQSSAKNLRRMKPDPSVLGRDPKGGGGME